MSSTTPSDSEQPRQDGATRGRNSDLHPSIKLLADELAGKHNAAQVYDERIWRVRTGVLTLAFAAWGALLAVGDSLNAVAKGALPMLVVTLALLLGGFVVELFYVGRKCRCTKVINTLGINLYDVLSGSGLPTLDRKFVQQWLRFSGDDDEIKPASARGYRWALWESLVIYVLPAIGFVLVTILLPAVGQLPSSAGAAGGPQQAHETRPNPSAQPGQPRLPSAPQ